MSKTERGWLGAELGACVWLVIVAWRALASALVPLAGSAGLRPLLAWPSRYAPLMAVLWIASLGLVLAGSRRSRAAVAVGICAQTVVGLVEARAYGEPFLLSFSLRFFLPMCLPLVPLVVRRAAGLRALVARARFREALAGAGGVAAALVAVGVLSVNHAVYAVLMGAYRGAGIDAWTALALPLSMFAIAGATLALGAQGAPAASDARA